MIIIVALFTFVYILAEVKNVGIEPGYEEWLKDNEDD